MFDRDELIERVAAELRRPSAVDPAIDARIMTAVAAEPRPARHGPVTAVWTWLSRPRTLRVSPLAGLAAAALVAVLLWRPWSVRPQPVAPHSAAVRFVYVDRAAASVVLVGDFNDWNAESTPLQRAAGDGVWTVVVPLGPGRYRYAFLIDGSRWALDPAAPHAGGDDFGTPNSVVTVAGAPS